MTYELKKVKINCFKKLDTFETEISNINILVGTNGSGKSSVLQGIHLACCTIRQDPEVPSYKSRVISVAELDYLPTDAYPELGNNSPWGNKGTSTSSKIDLTFKNDDDEEATSSCELRSARNHAGISISGSLPSPLQQILRKKIFSAYIPGISGIPNKEAKASKRVVQRACSFGDSNAYMRNILLLIKENKKINELQEWINKTIFPNRMEIMVDFDENKDLSLHCDVSINNRKIPLELIGTGYLQLMQIFSYILFLQPGLVLIDEPDNHLHPSVQEKLPAVLNECAIQNHFKVIVATHSPYVLRGAPIDAKVLWMNNGALASQERATLEFSLGWGIMGKKIIIFSEDQNISFLQKIVSQWPELDQHIKIHPGNGYQNLIQPNQAKQIIETLQNSISVLIHRDGDALTEEERTRLKEEYKASGAFLWITEGTDIEAYFCDKNIISKVCGISIEEASEKLSSAITKKQQETQDKFYKHRKTHNSEIWTEGGSPGNDKALEEIQKRLLGGAYGKGVLKELQNIFRTGVFSNDNILATDLRDISIAEDLKEILTEILKTRGV